MSIPRFGMCVALCTYLALLFFEYLRPGFVSTGMNVHALWIVIVACGIWEIAATKRTQKHEKTASLFRLCAMLSVGILLALIAWKLGPIFGDMRLFFALAVGMLPIILLK